MIPIQVAQATAPAQAVVPAQFDPGGKQTLAQAQGEGQRAIIVEQTAYLHAPFGSLHQGLDHGLGAGARLHQVQFQIHLMLGTPDRGEHTREKSGAVDQ
ncbi:hypothetical protein D3C79_852720 [compost metagenome]